MGVTPITCVCQLLESFVTEALRCNEAVSVAADRSEHGERPGSGGPWSEAQLAADLSGEGNPRNRFQVTADVVRKLIDKERKSDVLTATAFHQLPSSECLAPRFRPVVNDQHTLPRCENVSLQSKVGHLTTPIRRPRKLDLRAGMDRTWLSHRNEPRMKLNGHESCQHKAARLDSCDLVHARVSERRR